MDRSHADAARAIVLTALFGTRYSETTLHALERAILGDSDEYRALALVTGGELRALALYGTIAGAVGTSRLFFASSSRLIEPLVAELRTHDARLLIAELPDDAPFAPMRKLLLESGFQEESRVPDFIATGIALTFLRLAILR